MSLYKASSNSPENHYYFHPSVEDATDSIQTLLNYFNWENLVIFVSEDIYLQKCGNILFNQLTNRINNFFYITSETKQVEIDNFVGKMIKVASSRQFLLLTLAPASRMITNSLISKNIYSQGTGVIVFGEALAELDSLGIVGIIDKGCENITSSIDYSIVPITNLLAHLTKVLAPDANPNSLSDAVKVYFQHRMSLLSVININSTRIVVGTIIKSKISITKAMIYPGGSTSINFSLKTALQFSYAGGSSNSPGIASVIYNYQQMTGAVFAVMAANNDTSILPSFNFSAIYTDCGVSTSNYSFISSCLNKIKYFGVGFLSTAWSASTPSYIQYFTPTPIISIDSTLGLSNTTLYPSFTRVVASATYWSTVIASFVNVNGWKEVVILVSNVPKDIAMYALFLQIAEEYGITILNDEAHRFIMASYTRSNFDQEKETFQHVFNTGGRILIMLAASPDYFYIVEGLYDVGARRGDFQIISSTITGGNVIFASETPENAVKREELLLGALGTYTVEWIGTYGAEMQASYIKIFNQSSQYRCAPFDSAMLMIRSIAGALVNGYDYENPAILNKYIRQTRFTGCSGSVSIAQGTNDRSDQAAILENLYQVNGSWVEAGVAIFNPSNQAPFNIFQKIVWCDGSYNLPNDYRFSQGCPFDTSKAKDSSSGFTVLYIVCFIIALVAILISIFMIKAFANEGHEEISTKKLITAQDMFVFAIIILEIFQYFSLGTVPTDNSSVIDSISEISGVNFQRIITVSGSAYWHMILGTIIALWTWVTLCFTVILRSKRIWCFKSEIFEIIDFISEYVMPTLGDLGFLPIISMLMNLYVCTLCITDELTQSYNSHDCTTYCWTGMHLSYAVVSLISLAIYIPLSLYFRPIWQNYQGTINIRANSRYMIFKSVFQVFIIVFSKTVAYSNRYIFAYLYTGALLAYGIFLMRFKAFNYGVVNLWLYISIFLASYTEFIYAISISTPLNGSSVLGILIAGWVVILGAGYVIQTKRYISYLYSEPSKDIPEIIKEAFKMNKFKYKIGNMSEKDNEKENNKNYHNDHEKNGKNYEKHDIYDERDSGINLDKTCNN